jgi:uncharacterized glyoxalase superfamily protein PhnB
MAAASGTIDAGARLVTFVQYGGADGSLGSDQTGRQAGCPPPQPRQVTPMSSSAKQTIATIVPTFRYRDAPAAIAWLGRAFGLEPHLVVPGPDGTIAHAQLVFGHGMIMLSSASDGEYGNLVKTPAELGGVAGQSPYLIVADTDAHYAGAKAAGAEILIDIKDEDYGGRGYTCRDPEGYIWNFGSYDPWAAQN